MHIALSTFNFQVAMMLIACGVDISHKNASNENLIYTAAYVNALEVIQTLLQNADQNELARQKVLACLRETNCDGLTPANIAMIRGYLEIVDLMTHFVQKQTTTTH